MGKRLLLVPKEGMRDVPSQSFYEKFDDNKKVRDNAVISPPGTVVIFHDNLLHCGMETPESEWTSREQWTELECSHADLVGEEEHHASVRNAKSISAWFHEHEGLDLLRYLRGRLVVQAEES